MRTYARHGLNFQMSVRVPGLASTLVVMYFGSSAPGIFSGSKPAARSSGQWSRFGSRVPFPSAALQPTETPCENQKHDWPAEHSSVPLPQWHVYGLRAAGGSGRSGTGQLLGPRVACGCGRERASEHVFGAARETERL